MSSGSSAVTHDGVAHRVRLIISSSQQLQTWLDPPCELGASRPATVSSGVFGRGASPAAWPQGPNLEGLCNQPGVPRSQTLPRHSTAPQRCESWVAAPTGVAENAARPLRTRGTAGQHGARHPSGAHVQSIAVLTCVFSTSASSSFSRAGQVKARPSVLWCYKKELGFTTCVACCSSPPPGRPPFGLRAQPNGSSLALGSLTAEP